MGSWGEGPLDSDDALDLVYNLESIAKEDRFKYNGVSFVKDCFKDLEEGPYDISVKGQEEWANDVMATAAWLFECRRYDISCFSNLISQAIDIAIINANSREIGWVSPSDRINEMIKFREKING